MAQINESTIKTPGVYVNEIPLFPPSVAQVETAIPAFIGYTEKAENFLEDDLILVPKKIRSLTDFREKFGGGPPINIQTIKIDNNNNVEKVEIKDRYYLYNCLRLFYSNGGGECYIVSVGKYNNGGVKLGEAESDNDNKNGLMTGLEKIRKIDEPTMLLAPDALALNKNDCYEMYKQMLRQCNDLQDRFAIFDVIERDTSSFDSKIQAFRNGIGINNLNYGAAYTPWLHTNISRTVRYKDIRDALDKNGSSINLEQLLNNAGDIDSSILAKRLENLSDDKLVIEKLYTDSDLNNLDLSATFSNRKNHFLSALDDLGESLSEEDENSEVDNELVTVILYNLNNLIKLYVKKTNFIFSVISNDEEGEEEVITDRSESGDDETYLHDYLKKNVLPKTREIAGKILSMEKEIGAIEGIDLDFDILEKSLIEKHYEDSGLPDWYTVQIDGADAKIRFFKMLTENKRDIINWGNTLQENVTDITTSSKNLLNTSEDSALSSITILKNIFRAVETKILTLPPSAAIAGVYAAVDRSRGVWKAPANVSLNNVVALTQSIDNRMQDGLNVDVNSGKSINVIREFHGKGYLVWGARTLSGNDNEWRYINVRRFFIMVEQSAKKATMQFVFEPNDANTWVKVRAMIENYLTVIWRQGALAGAKPEHAFYVRCGLNQTMGPQDILEGRMIVEIGLAAVRPAEFIILRFSHKLQES